MGSNDLLKRAVALRARKSWVKGPGLLLHVFYVSYGSLIMTKLIRIPEKNQKKIEISLAI